MSRRHGVHRRLGAEPNLAWRVTALHLRGGVKAKTSRLGTLEWVLQARLTCRGQRPATATESRCTSGYRLVGLVESFQGMPWRPMGANGEPRGGVASAALARKRVRHASQVLGLSILSKLGRSGVSQSSGPVLRFRSGIGCTTTCRLRLGRRRWSVENDRSLETNNKCTSAFSREQPCLNQTDR